MEFRILGPLEVRDGDSEVPVRGGKQHALLALLLVNANRTLAIDRIVDELWGEDVPESAHKMVQISVSWLRKVLPRGTLHTRPPGYAVIVEWERLDLHRFEELVAEARAALDAGRSERAAAGFRRRSRSGAASARGVRLGAVRAARGGAAGGPARLRARGTDRSRPAPRAPWRARR